MTQAPQKKPPRRIDWKNSSDTRLCYTISEVAKMYQLSEITLRYWEKETPLAPRRSSGGTRYYHREHLEVVDKLNFLINHKGLTLKAAAERLKSVDVDHGIVILEKLQETKQTLQALSDDLDHILAGHRDRRKS